MADTTRLIASDLDGTLLGPDRTISDRTATTLQHAADEGIVVVAATGRGKLSALPLIRSAPAISWAICSNGATLYDMSADELVHNVLLERDQAVDMVAAVRSTHPDIGLAWETEQGFFWDTAYQEHRYARLGADALQLGKLATGSLGGERSNPSDPAHGNVLKVLFTHPELGFDSWMAEIAPLLPGNVVASNSGTDFVEITAEGVHKGAAVAALSERLGIDAASVVTFGDQDNDRSMLEWAGRGYAMANAHPSIRDGASHLAPSNEADGVAVVVEEMLAARRI